MGSWGKTIFQDFAKSLLPHCLSSVLLQLSEASLCFLPQWPRFHFSPKGSPPCLFHETLACHSILTLVFPDTKWCFISRTASTFLDKIFLLQLSLYQHFYFCRREVEYAGKTEMGTVSASNSLSLCDLSLSTYPICSYKAYPFPVPPLILDFQDFFFSSGSQVRARSLNRRTKGKHT